MTAIDYDAWHQRLMEDTADLAEYDIFDIRHKDALASRTHAEHIPRLLVMASSEVKLKRSCAWSLMRHLITDHEVLRRCLRTAWDRTDLDDDERNALLWRVLDDEDLPNEYQRKIWNWMRDNRATLVRALREYLQPKLDEGISFNDCMEWSLEPGRHPLTKQWVYLVSAALAADNENDKARARALLDKWRPKLRGTFADEVIPQLMKLLQKR